MPHTAEVYNQTPGGVIESYRAAEPWTDPRYSLSSFQTFQTFPRACNSKERAHREDREVGELLKARTESLVNLQGHCNFTNNDSNNNQRSNTRKEDNFDESNLLDQNKEGQDVLYQNKDNSNEAINVLDEDKYYYDLRETETCLGSGDRRFGFSVIGGVDEGFSPQIEEITKGSPADRADLEVGDEILEVNGKSLENCTHTEVISHIHQCIRSRTICLRVKRKTGSKLAQDLAQNSNVQDAFVIAVEQQARERLERLSALKKIKPVDMTKLSQELNECPHSSPELNGVIENNPIYVTSVPELQSATLERIKQNKVNNSKYLSDDFISRGESFGDDQYPSANGHCQPVSSVKDIEEKDQEPEGHDQELELKQEILESKTNALESNIPDVVTFCSQQGKDHSKPLCTDKTFSENTVILEKEKDCTVTTVSPTIEATLLEESKYKMEVEQGPHREMAVDVPDSFVGVRKAPPRYPPPKPVVIPTDLSKFKKGVPPEPPTRTTSFDPGRKKQQEPYSKDSRISSDVDEVHTPLYGVQLDTGSMKSGSVVYKPHVNGRTVSPQTSRLHMNGVTEVSMGKNVEEERLERIRKYQEDIRKRKEEEERIAQEEEFLRSSLRGSRKLQALESTPQTIPRSGIVNTAFDLEESNIATLPVGQQGKNLIGGVVNLPGDLGECEELKRIVDYQEILMSFDRLQTYLHNNGIKSLDLANIEEVLKDEEFKTIMELHNRVQNICCFNRPPTPFSSEAQYITQDAINSLQECSLQEAAELHDILSKYEFEGLMFAHDKVAENQALPEVTPDEELLDLASQYTEDSVKIVRIDKTNEPLGATVRNEGEAVVIGRIVKGGAAEKSGLLHEGDEILEVNSIEMRGKSVNEVCDILATMNGTLTFVVVPSHYESQKLSSKDSVMHVKAHFDYDPDDDLYIPCRELGISFQKGDILHILNQDDPNWWQAFREGEEDQSLAGLVPSKSFQQQREAMKQTIVGETNNREKSKKGKFLCARKHYKKEKKKALYNANLSDECDLEQILTYEEVALYYPRANHKRPVVLVGPPNIGRHELRQRLMEDTERFAAAIPHTSRPKRDGEFDDVDYHFITRAQFEADILAGKFVEHGEYEKNYYGTSLDAIRSVVNSGKICVLNLHPQSLKILKHSDLKPYVVFVAPPSLEKLRQNYAKMGASVKDEELKDIIEKAREMEDNYGHYFDMIIINSDIDKAYNELVKEINILEREPQWVPAFWLKNDAN
ncbi:LOW QUALITY PROTEIN: MAGUK p55 subfamily member 5-A-like [Limulus polyphemus]|uniref:LOW QUALITY PROTEIN: MAGUK p55 subfamily member 5-A-like n=1 Tax=Limulus polyphemus TaxID=6850 RepID=A0ABM1SBG8_LIMPO|nr:LOW QUALITY PROTEIN: MAGUK p55 subfamily member 5-A-like [Limulus polyphemus]